MDQLGKCQKKSCSFLCELLGPTPTNTMKLCQGKQIGKKQMKEGGGCYREKEKKREKSCLKQTGTFGALDKHSNSC